MKKKFTPAEVWEKFGISEHYGGVYATQRLIKLCGINPGQYVLEIGCGTGHRDIDRSITALGVGGGWRTR